MEAAQLTTSKRLAAIPGFGIDRVAAAAGTDPDGAGRAGH